jgi:hypothetical protein
LKPTNITNYHKSEDKILIAFFKHKEDNKRMVKDGSYQRRYNPDPPGELDDHNDDHHDNTGNDQDTTGTAAATGVAGDQLQPQG